MLVIPPRKEKIEKKFSPMLLVNRSNTEKMPVYPTVTNWEKFEKSPVIVFDGNHGRKKRLKAPRKERPDKPLRPAVGFTVVGESHNIVWKEEENKPEIPAMNPDQYQRPLTFQKTPVKKLVIVAGIRHEIYTQNRESAIKQWRNLVTRQKTKRTLLEQCEFQIHKVEAGRIYPNKKREIPQKPESVMGKLSRL